MAGYEQLVGLRPEDPVMSGEEKYALHGSAITKVQLRDMIRLCKGCKVHWDCIRKALTAFHVLGEGVVTIGSCTIKSKLGNSTYSFQFNPPTELHAWLALPGGVIVDVGLAGAILKGKALRDKRGPFLVGNKTVVLAANPPAWVKYQAVETIKAEDREAPVPFL